MPARVNDAADNLKAFAAMVEIARACSPAGDRAAT
jgi:hypothetical protein